MSVSTPPRPDLFGKALRARRRRLDLTQRELAHEANVSVQAVRLYEAGAIPKRDSDALKAVCSALKL